ncbi:universal stress protein [Thermococcus sp.]|uniref:universal stress protein n=1 Tax=Thermococcus sp. TaxID=35749 RepID=UPI00262AD118|nr:universal stress protein [Thermococcus sp.]
MVNFSGIILRKFKNIAGSRYEEIMKAYQEFFLTEEELQIPEVKSILLVLDRFSGEVPEEVFEVLSAYPGARIEVVYVIDEGLCSIIGKTLGEEEAEAFRKSEESLGRELLRVTERSLSKFDLSFSMEITFADKVEFVENDAKNRDILVVSRHFGSESTKTHRISPIVFRIVQGVKKPVIVY